MLGKFLALQEDPQQDHREQEAGMRVHCSLRVRRRCRKAGGDSPIDPARLAGDAALPGEKCPSIASPFKNRSFLSGIPACGRHIGGITGGIQLVARWVARYFFKRQPNAAEELAVALLGSRNRVAFIRAGTTLLSLRESVFFLKPAAVLEFRTSGCEANGNERGGSAERAMLSAGT
ncbi:hypothetical protein [Labrys sp. (in: a-proteobacteria)]|uniref:hypothetical protein n=1 Tax=Labrys sp. (in: a-proteobacteria) TaxID=1917972 RepID=UPI0039E58271